MKGEEGVRERGRGRENKRGERTRERGGEKERWREREAARYINRRMHRGEAFLNVLGAEGRSERFSRPSETNNCQQN